MINNLIKKKRKDNSPLVHYRGRLLGGISGVDAGAGLFSPTLTSSVSPFSTVSGLTGGSRISSDVGALSSGSGMSSVNKRIHSSQNWLL